MKSAKLFSSGSKEHNVEYRGRMRKLVKKPALTRKSGQRASRNGLCSSRLFQDNKLKVSAHCFLEQESVAFIRLSNRVKSQL